MFWSDGRHGSMWRIGSASKRPSLRLTDGPSFPLGADLVPTLGGTGQNEPSTALRPASRLVAEVKPRSREAGHRRRRA